MDRVRYGTNAPPWPALANQGGVSLQLIDPAQDNSRVANWAAMAGGSGGGSQNLITITDTWKYDQSGIDLGTAWRAPGYSDSSWPAGPALLYVEESALPAPKNTPLVLGRRTYYFRTSFTFSGNPATVESLRLSAVIDDGAVFYLNGSEIYRSACRVETSVTQILLHEQ